MRSSLTPRQRHTLEVVGEYGPVTPGDVAYHLLSSPAAERSRLAALERRGLVERQYTGHHRGGGSAYVLAGAGRHALDTGSGDPE